MQEREVDLGLPKLEAGQYLLESFMLAGPSKVDGFGEASLEWSDLWGYAQATGDIQEPWEFEALYEMSRGYVAAKAEGAEHGCVSPVERSGDYIQDKREKTAASIKAAMRGKR